MSSTPAGWYPDPYDRRRIRYWDGLQWTGQTAPGSDGAPGAAANGPAMRSYPSSGNGPAQQLYAQPYPAPGSAGVAAGGNSRTGLILGTVAAVAVVVVVIFIVGAVAAGSGSALMSPGERAMGDAIRNCRDATFVETFVGAINAETNSNGVGDDGVRCVLTATGASHSLRYRMDHTNALMGWQEAHEDGLLYGWSYHPDNGFRLSVSVDD